MPDLYDAFAAAAAPLDVTEERRALVVDVISQRAASRRRVRLAMRAAGGAASTTAVVAAIAWGAGAFAPSPSTLDPGAAAPVPSASLALPTDVAAPVDPLWDTAGPGWFAVTYTSEDSEPRLALVDAQGSAYAVDAPGGEALGEGRSLVGWRGAALLVFATADDGATVAAATQGTAVVEWPAGEATAVGVLSEGADAPEQVCLTGDRPGDALLTPGADAIVCFVPDDDGHTALTLVPLAEGEAPRVLTTFEFPASSYARLGWADESTLLFGRELNQGYRYFTYNIATGNLRDVFLPGDLDGWVPRFDLASGTYAVERKGMLDFVAGDGTNLAGIGCPGDEVAGSAPAPRAWFSGQSALLTCEPGGKLAGSTWVLDLTTGFAHELALPGGFRGEIDAAAPFPYLVD